MATPDFGRSLFDPARADLLGFYLPRFTRNFPHPRDEPRLDAGLITIPYERSFVAGRQGGTGLAWPDHGLGTG